MPIVTLDPVSLLPLLYLSCNPQSVQRARVPLDDTAGGQLSGAGTFSEPWSEVGGTVNAGGRVEAPLLGGMQGRAVVQATCQSGLGMGKGGIFF